MKTNIKAIIKSAMANRNYTQAALAKDAGWKNQSSLSTAINRDNPSLETIVRIMDAMGYDIVIKDRKNQTTSWPIERVEDEE